jgi:hypothetical protein
MLIAHHFLQIFFSWEEPLRKAFGVSPSRSAWDGYTRSEGSDRYRLKMSEADDPKSPPIE